VSPAAHRDEQALFTREVQRVNHVAFVHAVCDYRRALVDRPFHTLRAMSYARSPAARVDRGRRYGAARLRPCLAWHPTLVERSGMGLTRSIIIAPKQHRTPRLLSCRNPMTPGGASVSTQHSSGVSSVCSRTS
jgi:hypothetical protein